MMDNLPTQRVFSIRNLKINPQASGYMNFSVEVDRTDSKPWKDWFNTAAAGAKKMDASIILLDQNTGKTITTFQLPEVEILSVSELNSPSALKTVFGLRTPGIQLR
jgi:hypothetical protein